MKYIALLALLQVTGCPLLCTSVQSQQVKSSTPPEPQVFAGLRFEAHKHHLRWFVFCVPDHPGKHYDAVAKFDDDPEGSTYIEDGAKDWWQTRGTSAIDAAYKLYLLLAANKAPSFHPDHKPGKDPSACDYNTVYDSEHAGKIPCEAK